ncbi:leucyl/phenylalanyl-tRNA--protein transferase [Verrucomicrobium sp. GAS474]|uniref:leucyl/phenylalanyl-tRNA--protein transferase n=1 Tax=Verrucomicrobium sp. GAS474 TaxID=1882831 RepID=UPI000879D2B6|nr:leucyl/phenylalanyl-tRNA--protein transferase [Verrucomicrobium sp. GAS474]SDT87178.1 leucyl/phenylalanyl-tRNA--protein transferase [Verrucomicrobium sp. GAS474]
MKVSLLHPRELAFPPVDQAQRDGLLAVGGDLSIPRLLEAYRHGVFPWTEDPVTWWSPDPRAVFDLAAFHTPKRLVQKFRQGRFRITRDAAFPAVIAGCAEPAPGREETWITPGFVAAYTALHREGHAHSVEVWEGETLVGGIYGVALGGFFAGESMFHRVTDASKLALCALAAHLRGAGFTLFDTQVATPITRTFGAVDIPRKEYLRRLEAAVALPARF